MRIKLSRIAVAFILLVVVVVAAAPSVAPSRVHAQDDMGVQCDGTLLLLLLLAEENGFKPMSETQYDHGQWTPFFDAMMAMMEEESMEEEGTMMDEETMGMMEDMMGMSVADQIAALAEMGMETNYTILPTGAVADEAPECTALREELNSWFFAYLYAQMTMDMMEEGQ